MPPLRRAEIAADAAYAAPFGVFVALLVVMPYTGLSGRGALAVWAAVLVAALAGFSRKVIAWRPSFPLQSVAVGAAVFGLWVLPDLVFPDWRSHWLFQNPLVGGQAQAMPAETWRDPVSAAMRALRAVALVPVIEELFWRGWLMRWLIERGFESIPPGTYSRRAFWWTAALFALEHGSYWDVGLMAGIAYNLWIIRSKNLGDAILAHAVTNACLSAYVLWGEHWRYWS
jgi:hypothetical protein